MFSQCLDEKLTVITHKKKQREKEPGQKLSIYSFIKRIYVQKLRLRCYFKGYVEHVWDIILS